MSYLLKALNTPTTSALAVALVIQCFLLKRFKKLCVMKTFEIFAIILLVALIATIAVLTGLRLDDMAQDIQQATWHIAN